MSSENIQVSVLDGFKEMKPMNVENKSYVSDFFSGWFTSSSEPGKLDFTKIIIFLLVIALLGFNIFNYLGDIVDWFKNTFGPLFGGVAKSVGTAVTDTTSQTLDIAAEGTKAGVDIATGTLKSGIDVLEGQLDWGQLNKNASLEEEIAEKEYQRKKSEIAQTTKKMKSTKSPLEPTDEIGRLRQKEEPSLARSSYSAPVADDALSRTQSKGSGKSGYCYIGEDRGFRSCIKVKDSDMCMSGDIFPSMDLCINPNLRD